MYVLSVSSKDFRFATDEIMMHPVQEDNHFQCECMKMVTRPDVQGGNSTGQAHNSLTEHWQLDKMTYMQYYVSIANLHTSGEV